MSLSDMDQEQQDPLQPHDSESIENIETLWIEHGFPPFHPSTWAARERPVYYHWWEDLSFGIPSEIFKRESKRELERLIRQEYDALSGRPRSLPFDPQRTLAHNAENNVRARWIEQGIWIIEWGMEWPRANEPSSFLEGSPSPGPHWAHEDCQTSNPAQIPFATDPEASRPFRQFSFQVAKERERLEAEYKWAQQRPPMYLDIMALETTKKTWQDDGIWAPTWGDLPGERWLHEEPNLERFIAPERRLPPLFGLSNRPGPFRERHRP